MPVVPHGNRADIVQATFKASYLWEHVNMFPHVNLFSLTENMRVKNAGDDGEYANFLLDVGNGNIPTNPEIEEDMISIPSGMESKQDNLEGFCQEIFPNLGQKIKDGMKNMDYDDNWNNFVHNRAIICPRNIDVDDVNKICLEQMDEEPTVFLSADRCMEESDQINYPVEFLNKLVTSGTPNHELVLKKGAPIILMRNLDAINGHVNGAQ